MVPSAAARPVRRLASLVFCAALPSAWAASGTLTASTGVDTFCTVSTAPLAFGAYDPIVANVAAALNASSSVSIACVKGTTPTIALGLGNHANVQNKRRMQHQTNATTFLVYELYQPPNTTPGTPCAFPGTTAWGSSGANLFSPSAATDKNSRTFDVCGTVPAGQNVEVGNYSDTVVVTVSF